MTRLGALLFVGVVLTSCSDPDTQARHVFQAQQSELLGQIVDKGAVDLPNKPGYKIHAYINVVPPYGTRHYLYVIEKDGLPMSGVNVDTPNGKQRQSVTTVVRQ